MPVFTRIDHFHYESLKRDVITRIEVSGLRWGYVQLKKEDLGLSIGK
jgi:hypothetical protein